MAELHTVSLYDEEGGKQNSSLTPSTLEIATATGGVATEISPHDPPNQQSRASIIIAAVYVTICVSFWLWASLSEFDGWDVIVVGILFVPVAIVELVLTIISTILTYRKWKQYGWLTKIVGLIPLVVSVAWVLWFVIVVVVQVSREVEIDEGTVYEPPELSRCNAVELCKIADSLLLPDEWNKTCFLPDVFPEQDCESLVVEKYSDIEGCNFTAACSGIILD